MRLNAGHPQTLLRLGQRLLRLRAGTLPLHMYPCCCGSVMMCFPRALVRSLCSWVSVPSLGGFFGCHAGDDHAAAIPPHVAAAAVALLRAARAKDAEGYWEDNIALGIKHAEASQAKAAKAAAEAAAKAEADAEADAARGGEAAEGDGGDGAVDGAADADGAEGSVDKTEL